MEQIEADLRRAAQDRGDMNGIFWTSRLHIDGQGGFFILMRDGPVAAFHRSAAYALDVDTILDARSNVHWVDLTASHPQVGRAIMQLRECLRIIEPTRHGTLLADWPFFNNLELDYITGIKQLPTGLPLLHDYVEGVSTVARAQELMTLGNEGRLPENILDQIDELGAEAMHEWGAAQQSMPMVDLGMLKACGRQLNTLLQDEGLDVRELMPSALRMPIPA